MLASLDFGRRVVRLGPTFFPGEDIDAELRRVEKFFAPVRGCNAQMEKPPEGGSSIEQ